MVENMAALFSVQALLLLAPLVSVPYLVRILGAEAFGQVVLAQALVGYFALLTDYGFNLSATREAVAVQDDPAQLSRLFTAVTLLKAAICCAGFVVMAALVSVLPMFEQDLPLYALAYLAALGNVLFPIWLFQALERSRVVAGCLGGAQALTLAGLFVFVNGPQDYRVAAALQGGTTVVGGLLSLLVIRHSRAVSWLWPGMARMRAILADGWHVFTSAFAVSLYSQTNTIVVGAVAGPVAVGYFSAADKLIRAVQGCVTPLSQAVYPQVAKLRSVSVDAALALIRRLLRWQGGVTLVISLLVAVLAAPLVHLIFGSTFSDAVPLVRYMAVLPFVVGISNVLGVQTMLNFGMQVTFSRVLITSGFLNLALIVPMTEVLGASGAALSLVITEVAVTLSMATVLARRGLMTRLLRTA